MRFLFVASLALLVVTVYTAAPRNNPLRANLETSRGLMKQFLTHGMTLPASGNPSEGIVAEDFFTARVDNFNLQNSDEWKLRYLAVTDWYQPGGPILIWLGNSPVAPYMIDESSLIYDMAREMHGAVYAFETRFFGKSRATENVSTENLRYLSTDQILADLAEFIVYLKRDVLHNENAHVLVSGMGFGGSLATWFRVRYPHLADAAWSSSGMHLALMNFQGFAEAWGQTLIDHGSQKCYNTIFVAFNVMQILIDVGREDILYDRLQLCSDFDTEDPLQVQIFFIIIMTMVEFNTLDTRSVKYFSDVCNEITESEAPNALDAFADWFRKQVGDGACALVDIHTFTELFQEDDWESPFVQMGLRQLLYQECTEFGWFQTTESDNQPFGNRITVDIYAQLCARVFGDWISFDSIYRGTERSNNRFGGLNPRINNVHFTNGGEDPFRTISIRNDLNSKALSDVIPNELMGSDTRAISENDSEELQAVKRRVKALLSQYLFPHGPRDTSVEN